MSNKKKVIGFFGAEVFSGNMGCLALTYSLLTVIHTYEKKQNVKFEYYFFVRNRHGDLHDFCEITGIEKSRIHIISCMDLTKMDFFLRDKLFKFCIKKCDLVLDLTQGDSFTDIYGQERFDMWTSEKEWVLNNGISLILGPQTFGPFNNETNKKRACNILSRSQIVFARDQISYDYVMDMCKSNIYLTCDLAFALPYTKNEKKYNKKKIIGINVSGLLWSDDAEDTEKQFILKADYHDYIKRVINYLCDFENIEIYLVSHVSADYKIAKMIKNQYKNVIIVEEFSNPVVAKNYISSCDFFIGSRMHATIAALSSGVPVIPVAYSRKFSGLFNTIDYPYVVDLNKLNSEEAFDLTIDYLKREEEIKGKIPQSLDKAEQRLKILQLKLDEILESKWGEVN